MVESIYYTFFLILCEFLPYWAIPMVCIITMFIWVSKSLFCIIFRTPITSMNPFLSHIILFFLKRNKYSRNYPTILITILVLNLISVFEVFFSVFHNLSGYHISYFIYHFFFMDTFFSYIEVSNLICFHSFNCLFSSIFF